MLDFVESWWEVALKRMTAAAHFTSRVLLRCFESRVNSLGKVILRSVQGMEILCQVRLPQFCCQITFEYFKKKWRRRWDLMAAETWGFWMLMETWSFSLVLFSIFWQKSAGAQRWGVSSESRTCHTSKCVCKKKAMVDRLEIYTNGTSTNILYSGTNRRREKTREWQHVDVRIYIVGN